MSLRERSYTREGKKGLSIDLARILLITYREIFSKHITQPAMELAW
jgi:hypothetical protein